MDDTATHVTAHHEAGHAVMSWHLRRPFRRASILAAGDHLGVVETAPPRWLADYAGWEDATPARRAWFEDRVQIALAGRIAQDAYIASVGREPDPEDRSDHHDVSIAVDLATLAQEGAPVAVVEAFVEYQRQRAIAAITGPLWPLVSTVAGALVERGSLTWPAFRDVVAGHYDVPLGAFLARTGEAR